MTQRTKQNNSNAHLDPDKDTKNQNPHKKHVTIYRFISQRHLAVFIVAVIVVAIVFLCYKYINNYKQITELVKRNTCLQQQINSIDTKINKLNNANDAIKHDYTQQKEKNKIISSVLSELKDNIKKMQDTDRTQWLVFEAEILVNLANQYLYTLKDKNQCLEIIQSASYLLDRADQNSTFHIREKLNSAIAKLQSITYINSEDIYLKLNFIEATVQSISVSVAIKNIKTIKKEPEVADSSATPNNKLTIYQFLVEKIKLLLKPLKELFLISKREVNDIYPLPQEQEINTIKLIIYSNIEQAKVSLLTKQQQIFNTSISNIKKYLEYLPSNNNVKLNSELGSLSKIDFSLSGADVLSEVLSVLAQYNTEVKATDKSINNQQDKPISSKESY